MMLFMAIGFKMDSLSCIIRVRIATNLMIVIGVHGAFIIKSLFYLLAIILLSTSPFSSWNVHRNISTILVVFRILLLQIIIRDSFRLIKWQITGGISMPVM